MSFTEKQSDKYIIEHKGCDLRMFFENCYYYDLEKKKESSIGITAGILLTACILLRGKDQSFLSSYGAIREFLYEYVVNKKKLERLKEDSKMMTLEELSRIHYGNTKKDTGVCWLWEKYSNR